MAKFCGKCGAEIKDEFCTSCGAKASEASKVSSNNDVNEYFHGKLMSKKRHDLYRIIVGIVMLILGFLIAIAALMYEDLDLSFSVDNVTLAFLIPGIFTFIGGLFSIISKKVNVLLLISGISYIVAAIVNAIGIENISLLFILCAIFAPLNIVYYFKAEKLGE